MEQIQPQFILELFRLSLHDKHTLQIVINTIKQNWLTKKEERLFLAELIGQAEDKKKPTFGTFKQAFRDNEAMLGYVQQIQDTELQDPDTIAASLEGYVKNSLFIEMYDKSADLFNKGNKSAAYSFLSKGVEKLNNFSLSKTEFEPVFAGFTRRHTARIMERASHLKEFIFCGIDGVDDQTGGFLPGELVLFLGEAKSSKSQALIHCGVNFARRGYKGAHIQAEGTDKEVKDRYDAAWSGSVYSEIRHNTIDDEKLFKKYKNVSTHIGDGEVFIYTSEKFNSLTMVEIRHKIIELKRRFPDLKFIIIDYVDLINPDVDKYGPNDERYRQRKTIRMMKDLAKELDVVIISATQASNIPHELSQDPAFVIKREHLAEDKGKVQVVDYLITINRTLEEAKNGICRLWLEAARNVQFGKVVKIYQNLKCARFYDRKRTFNEGLADEDE